MNSNIELIIFDMDGLMYDTEKISYEAWVRAAEIYDYKINDEIFNLTLGANLEKTKRIFMNYFGENFPIDEVIRERVRISDEILVEKGVPIKKGLYELLEYLNDNKIRMAVATSTNRERAMALLLQSRVIDYFDCIVCGDEVEYSKSNPEIFIKVIDALSCKPESTIVLEDSESGIEAAYRAGMLPIMIPDVIQPSERTKEKLYKQFSDLTQVINVIRR